LEVQELNLPSLKKLSKKMKLIYLLLIFCFYNLASQSQTNNKISNKKEPNEKKVNELKNDTMVLNLSKFTDADRIIIMDGGFITPNLDQHLRKNMLEACCSAINCTVKTFEFFETYDVSKLDEAENLLKLAEGLLKSSEHKHETANDDYMNVEENMLENLTHLLNDLIRLNENESDRTIICKIDYKYFHVSKTIGVPSLTALAMLQVKLQNEYNKNLKYE